MLIEILWYPELTVLRRTIRQTKDLISEYIQKCPASRNAQLARLKFVQSQVSASASGLEALLSECKDYFDRNGRKVYCFQDLRKYLPTLEPSLQSAFQLHVSENDALKNPKEKVCTPSTSRWNGANCTNLYRSTIPRRWLLSSTFSSLNTASNSPTRIARRPKCKSRTLPAAASGCSKLLIGLSPMIQL